MWNGWLFVAISRFPLSYFGHHPHRKFSRIKTNILMVLHAIPRSTEVRSSHVTDASTARFRVFCRHSRAVASESFSLATGLALANVSNQVVAVPVVLRDDTGATLGTATMNLAARGHT
jgi:hypothetical protein